MTADHFRTMTPYNRWASRRLYAAAAALLRDLPAERETAAIRGLAAPVSYWRVRLAG